ncbi:hypothetical protein [Embleya sp. NPDC005971]|uniref:hypothetical protein n=2 Tax=Embleya TaxID=2699295 RepID=UPI0033E571F7
MTAKSTHTAEQRELPPSQGVETLEGTDERLARPRFSVALISAAAKSMTYLLQRTELNKNDIVNRALQVYAYLEQRQEEGYDLFLHDENGNIERLRIM